MVENWTYSFGHTNTGITDCKGLVLLVWNNVDSQILARIELWWIWESFISNLVQSIWGVGDEFSKENLLVGVDCVDDERQELRDLSLKLEAFWSHIDCELMWLLKVGCQLGGLAGLFTKAKEFVGAIGLWWWGWSTYNQVIWTDSIAGNYYGSSSNFNQTSYPTKSVPTTGINL